MCGFFWCIWFNLSFWLMLLVLMCQDKQVQYVVAIFAQPTILEIWDSPYPILAVWHFDLSVLNAICCLRGILEHMKHGTNLFSSHLYLERAQRPWTMKHVKAHRILLGCEMHFHFCWWLCQLIHHANENALYHTLVEYLILIVTKEPHQDTGRFGVSGEQVLDSFSSSRSLSALLSPRSHTHYR